MAGLEKKFGELEKRIERLEQAMERRDIMMMQHESKLFMLAKDGIVWDKVKVEHGSTE